MTPLERELLACLREARRLHNQTVTCTSENDAWHEEADRLLSIEPCDDWTQRLDDRDRQEHRNFVRRLYYK